MNLPKAKTLVLFICAAIVLPAGLCGILRLYGEMEAYCFFYPSIDTTYAADYSEKAFNRIRNGFSSEEVIVTLGQPISTHTNQLGQVEWWYSRDGKCRWGDFAWLGRAVIFQNGVVTQTVKQIFYD